MNDRLVVTDELLRQALERRMAHAPSPFLLERIVAGAGTVGQDRAPLGWIHRPRRRSGAWARLSRLPALAGAAAVVLASILVVAALRLPVDVPGASPSPSPVPTPTRAALSPPAVTPEPVDISGHAALRLPLGFGTDPIDTMVAFGSAWTADIHGGDVRRFDPATLALEARIPLPPESGPAWLIATSTEVWVTNQRGSGLTRIDPATNTVIGRIGAGPTCGAPFQALQSIWQSACDAHTFLRLDPDSGATLDTIPAAGHGFLVAVGEQLITSNAEGLVELDAATGSFTPIRVAIPGYRDPASGSGQLFASDGTFVWIATDTGPARVDLARRRIVATFPYPDASIVTFSGGHAWLVAGVGGVVEIDLATNEVVQTIPVSQSQLVAREADGALWVTDFENSDLWRIEP